MHCFESTETLPLELLAEVLNALVALMISMRNKNTEEHGTEDTQVDIS